MLRELEQKKPQLDDLVGSADCIKDGASGSKQLPAQGKIDAQTHLIGSIYSTWLPDDFDLIDRGDNRLPASLSAMVYWMCIKMIFNVSFILCAIFFYLIYLTVS